jgi:hypothetical protein
MKIVIPFEDKRDKLRIAIAGFCRLLAGERYIALTVVKYYAPYESTVRCWNVRTGRMVWEWNRPRCTDILWALDFCEGGGEAIISIVSGAIE